jgi:hypothetical protein
MVLSLLLLAGCHDNSVAPTISSTLQLSLQGKAILPLYVHVHAVVQQTPWQLMVKRNGVTIFYSEVFNKTTLDTFVVDDQISPGQKYSYKAFEIKNTAAVDSSSAFSVSSLSPSNGNFTWHSYMLGNDGGIFHDVAILSDNSIWAVGSLFFSDSSAYPFYNIAHWNGSSWTFSCAADSIQGSPNPQEFYAISATSDSDIWASNWTPFHWNGATWGHGGAPKVVLSTMTKLFANATNNVYATGIQGTLDHYDGSNWQSINTGYTNDFTDVWGALNVATGSDEIYALSSVRNGAGRPLIVGLKDTTLAPILAGGLPVYSFAVWFVPGERYYLAGKYVYSSPNVQDTSLWYQHQAYVPANGLLYAMRGNDVNDLFAVGDSCTIEHFDGYEWKSYPELGNSSGRYNAVAVRGNTVVAVGNANGLAIATIGTR